MKSILDMLKAITDCPDVDLQTRTRAGFLIWRLSGSGLGFVPMHPDDMVGSWW